MIIINTILILISIILMSGLKSKTNFSNLKIFILGLTLTIPSLLIVTTQVVYFTLQFLSITMFKMGCILGGSDFNELLTSCIEKQVEDMLGKVKGDTSKYNDKTDDDNLQ